MKECTLLIISVFALWRERESAHRTFIDAFFFVLPKSFFPRFLSASIKQICMLWCNIDFQWKARIRTNFECYFAFYFYFKALVVISFDTFKYHYAHRIARYNCRFKGKMNKICIYYNWIETVVLHGKEHPSIELLSSHFTQVKWNAPSSFTLDFNGINTRLLHWNANTVICHVSIDFHIQLLFRILSLFFFYFREYDSLRSKEILLPQHWNA